MVNWLVGWLGVCMCVGVHVCVCIAARSPTRPAPPPDDFLLGGVGWLWVGGSFINTQTHTHIHTYISTKAVRNESEAILYVCVCVCLFLPRAGRAPARCRRGRRSCVVCVYYCMLRAVMCQYGGSIIPTPSARKKNT